jgi:hypothetical protein
MSLTLRDFEGVDNRSNLTLLANRFNKLLHVPRTNVVEITPSRNLNGILVVAG